MKPGMPFVFSPAAVSGLDTRGIVKFGPCFLKTERLCRREKHEAA